MLAQEPVGTAALSALTEQRATEGQLIHVQ
jgi:hypothetical protein